jgi:hypothetical protein
LVVKNQGGALAGLAKSGAADRCESCTQKHILHREPVVYKLVFVALAETQIHDFHRGLDTSAPPIYQCFRSLKIPPKHKFAVGHDKSKAAASVKHPMYFPSYPLSIGEREMLQYMFAKDTVEAFGWKR